MADKSRQLQAFKGGLDLTTFKTLTNNKESFITPLPDKIILPMHQHIGLPSTPTVKTGEHVLKGQKIADANSYVSVPVHASTSGEVVDIGAYSIGAEGQSKQECIVIKPDGNDTSLDVSGNDDYRNIEPEKLQSMIREAGIVGMGGAGFPAYVKLCEGTNSAVDTLIINGAECEPYISCDDRLIREKASYIVAGTRMLRHAIQAKYCVIAVEDYMPEAFAELNKLIDDDIELVMVPTRYPTGGEKQLIKTLTGKEVPSGGLPIHIGVVMHNVGTAAAAYRAVTRGEPLLSRYVTVCGEMNESRNLQVLLGTPVEHCLKQAGYRPDKNNIVIMGGPMMGKQIHNISTPVIKTTNCILVIPGRGQDLEKPCIRCGKCVDVCPASLLPHELFAYARNKDIKQLRELHLFDCIECGCCAYVCPSDIALVKHYRQAKSYIAEEEKKETGYDHARQRFEAHNRRLKRADDDIEQQSSLAEKQAYIKSAVKRVQKKRPHNNKNDQQ